MLVGIVALIIRYLLIMGGSALAGLGLVQANGLSAYCVDVSTFSNGAASYIIQIIGGFSAIAASIIWRSIAKVKGGVT